jgi:hypothetical protein
LRGSGGKAGTVLGYEVVEKPKQGTLSGQGPAMVYTANATATGSDSFTFRVSDGASKSPTAAVSITFPKTRSEDDQSSQDVARQQNERLEYIAVRFGILSPAEAISPAAQKAKKKRPTEQEAYGFHAEYPEILAKLAKLGQKPVLNETRLNDLKIEIEKAYNRARGA